MTAIFFRFLLTILWELVILVLEFYMLKSNIDVFFCDVISLLAQVFILNLSMTQFLWYDCTFKKTDRQTDRQTHRHTDTQTERVKTIPHNPLQGQGNYYYNELKLKIGTYHVGFVRLPDRQSDILPLYHDLLLLSHEQLMRKCVSFQQNIYLQHFVQQEKPAVYEWSKISSFLSDINNTQKHQAPLNLSLNLWRLKIGCSVPWPDCPTAVL